MNPMALATPVPTPSSTVDPNLVTPGPVGFVVVAILAIAVILLVWDMMRRIRRGRVRADIREELDAEQQLGTDGDADAADVDPDAGGDTR
jgi:hypothetical protein